MTTKKAIFTFSPVSGKGLELTRTEVKPGDRVFFNPTTKMARLEPFLPGKISWLEQDLTAEITSEAQISPIVQATADFKDMTFEQVPEPPLNEVGFIFRSK